MASQTAAAAAAVEQVPAEEAAVPEMDGLNFERVWAEGTPEGRHFGISALPRKYSFDIDEQTQRGISETYEFTEEIARNHVKMELENLPKDPCGFVNIQSDVKPRM